MSGTQLSGDIATEASGVVQGTPPRAGVSEVWHDERLLREITRRLSGRCD